MAHRLLICAALSEGETVIDCHSTSEDIEATANCISAMGADISYAEGVFTVRQNVLGRAECDCGESGSTLRFLLPVLCALGHGGSITMHGRLPQRPIEPLRSELISHGCRISEEGVNPLTYDGKLSGGVYTVPGDISSQYISGLLFALPLTGQRCEIRITGNIESLPYIKMTLDAIKQFGINVTFEDGVITIPEGQKYVTPKRAKVEGDWSNAAFPLCAAALGGEVTLTGICESLQGDREILNILRLFGAEVREGYDSVTVKKASVNPIALDATNIPDLVPVIAVTALGAVGKTVITGASRLRIKESDRITTVCEMIRNLGGEAEELPDGIVVHGKGSLAGGTVNAHGDHRIAMSAAVASVICDAPVTIIGAEAVGKSYPKFFQDFDRL
jgi:3-phosphoshikimate 1-carboxyvinyltransferase